MKEQMSPVVTPLVRYFASTRAEVLSAYLFGSHARGSHGDDSDVDVALLFTPQTQAKRLIGPLSQVRGDIERLLEVTVDVVDLRSAPVDLVHRVLREGVLLLDRDPEERAAYEVAARNAYFDLLPYIEAYRASVSA